MIYPLLQCPRLLRRLDPRDPVKADYFEAYAYGRNVSILSVNRQIHVEALQALYNNVVWSLRLKPESPPNIRPMLRGLRNLRKVELRFSIYDFCFLQAHIGRSQVVNQQREGFQEKINGLCNVLAKMPALQMIKLTWLEIHMGGLPENTIHQPGHSSIRCFLGCGFKAQALEIERKGKYDKDWRIFKELEKHARLYLTSWLFAQGPCAMAALKGSEQRIEHYWQQVLSVQMIVSRLMQPLLGISSTCSFEKGVIHVSTGTSWPKIYAMEQAFSNCVDAVMALQEEKKSEEKRDIGGPLERES